ncbi:MAG: glycolate oxidase subunit GlcF, partial [Gammaproteobacteria bacterium]|nr:glycolate oxidase subunit GlcF [Gammaproteobacteria bacterium]
MQTNISKKFEDNVHITEAENILRACVHCGFCTATCPTYQLLGDELDGPRGRIYLIKQVLEGKEVTQKTQQHLDRCLTCRSCETTCPSGVKYGRLADIGREIVEQRVPRQQVQQFKRLMLRKLLPYPGRMNAVFKLGYMFKPVLPTSLKRKLPIPGKIKTALPTAMHKRQMLVLQGCVQSVATPQTNVAASKILNKLGIELMAAPAAGCCGAVSHHLAATAEGLDFMRRNIDAWWPFVERGAEAIVITASGCGVMVKEYGELLKNDSVYADKAARVSELAKDISEILQAEDFSAVLKSAPALKVAFHSPCTLQHGQKLVGVVEGLLEKAGFSLTAVADAHLCCGSAGT